MWRQRKREGIDSLPLPIYSAPLGLRQGPGDGSQSSPDLREGAHPDLRQGAHPDLREGAPARTETHTIWGHVTTRDDHDDLQSEQRYVDELYRRLDAERAR